MVGFDETRRRRTRTITVFWVGRFSFRNIGKKFSPLSLWLFHGR